VKVVEDNIVRSFMEFSPDNSSAMKLNEVEWGRL
jgi:hypothetical protein